MRKSILLCIFIFSLQFLNAQPCINSSGFQKIYWNKGIANLSTYKTLQDKSGNIFLAGEVNLKVNSLTHVPYQLSVFVIKTNPNGTVLWEKSYNYYQSNTAFQNINVTNDGGLILILIGGIDITSSIIIKLDSNGNFQWSVAIKSTFLNTAIQLTSGNIIAAGNFNTIISANSIFCLTEQGNLVWSKTFKTDSYNTIPTVTELKTGELLVCGAAAHDSPTPSPTMQPHQHFFITKLDSKTGNRIWAKFFVSPDSVMLFNNSASSNYLYLRYNLHELPDKSFKLYVGDFQYPFPDANSYYHFDSSGNFLNSKRINASFNFYYTGTNAQNEDFFYGTDSSIAPILIKISNDAVAWARQFKSSASVGVLGWFNSGVVSNDGFLLSGYFITHKFSTTIVENEVQPYLIKTDSLGRTNCSDTFSVPIAIINGSPLFSYNGSWTDLPTIQIANTQIDVQNLLPQQIVDCSSTNFCCSDTVLYNSAVFCNSSSSYTLPDETVVHQSGIYYSDLKTAKGCDSVIFTSLTQASAPKIFLGDDTCLTNNIPLTIRIPHDSLTHFLWQDGSTTSSYTITNPGIYWTKAASVCGTTTDSIKVYPQCILPISVPNAFTPNGDGRNDVFKIADMKNQQLIDFSIYNRYGQKVFETKDPLKGWDGKLQGQNLLLTTFVYIIYYKDLKSQLHYVKGNATLIK